MRILNKKVFLFGSSGHLGSYVKIQLEEFNHISLFCPSREEVKKILNGDRGYNDFRNSIFINLVSIVGSENLSVNSKNEIENINCLFPYLLAKICDYSNSKLIHMSSNSVFDNSPERFRYVNTELNSNTIYGISKIKAEINIKSILDEKKYNIIRTPQHYSMNFNHKRNLFYGLYQKLNLEKRIIIDRNETFTIASCKQISKFILKIIKNDFFGIHHACEKLNTLGEILLIYCVIL